MINYISLQNIMLAVFGAAVFVIVLITVHQTLQKTLFQGRTANLMALAVSALCVVGTYQFLGISIDSFGDPETGNDTNVTLNYLLLPYFVFTIAILLSPLLLFASKLLPHMKSNIITKGAGSLVKKPKSMVTKSKPGRPKNKEKAPEKESKEVSKTGREAAAMSKAVS
ncbi:hypothetical protein ACFL5F_04035 [Planctomycetota bacterium]